MTFFIALFILLMQFLWKYIDDLVGKGLDTYTISQLLFYASATFVPMALPLAVLLSSLMTFGNLGEHYELVALKAAGISVWKIMRPLIYLSFLLSILAFIFSNNVLPVANLKFQSLLYDVRQQKLAFNINEGVFYNGINNYIIRVGEKAKDGRTIYDVKIYDHTDRQGNISVTTAKSGIMEMSPDQKSLIFTLFDGFSYNDIVNTRNYKENRPFERTEFSEQRIKFDLSDFDLARTQEDLFKSHYTMLNIGQLNTFIDSLELKFDDRKERYNQNFLKRFQYLTTIDTAYTGKKNTKPAVTLAKTDTAYAATKSTKKRLKKDMLSSPLKVEKSGDTIPTKWPILENFTKSDQSDIVNLALAAGRTTRDNIVFNKNDFIFQAENIRKHEWVWHKKFTLSFACLILFFVGAPMGAIIRKGGLGLPVVISVLFFVIYHVTSIFGEKSAKVGDLDMFFGVWLSSIILLPIGFFLTFKATTDAPLLDADSWRKMFRRIVKRANPMAGK
jgi:lipopolysaccharide export system permease protein